MGILKWAAVAAIGIAAMVGKSEAAVRLGDPATPDERAIVDGLVAQLAERGDCIDAHTLPAPARTPGRQWIELSDEAAAPIEAASRSTRPRAVSIPTSRGWMVPALLSMFARCEEAVHMSTPAVSGNAAFVTIWSDSGSEINFLRRRADGWTWHTGSIEGRPQLDY